MKRPSTLFALAGFLWVGPGPNEPGGGQEVIDFRPEHEINYRLDPLKPRPSRRWVIFGPRVRREGGGSRPDRGG